MEAAEEVTAPAGALAREPLGRKQSSSHEHWLAVWEAVSRHPDHARARRLVEEAADLTRRRIGEVPRANATGWGYSGGKDSLALLVVMEAAGLDDLPAFAGLTRLEWPAFEGWLQDPAHRPGNLHVDRLGHIDLAWLRARPDYLFPKERASRWFPHVQRAAEKRFVNANGLDLMIGGWRRADGNYLGTARRRHEYRTPNGHHRFSPISQWSHEDVLHVIASFGKSLPPLYGYARGFPLGTGPWPARPRAGTLAEAWREVHDIDPDLVHTASAAGFTSATNFLEGIS